MKKLLVFVLTLSFLLPISAEAQVSKRTIAIKKLDMYYSQTVMPDIEYELYFSPNVDIKLQQKQTSLFKKTLRFWSKDYIPKGFKAIYFDNQDGAWANDLNNNLRMFNGMPFEKITKDIYSYCDAGNSGNEWQFVQCLPDYDKYKIKTNQTTPHEYTHCVQNYFVGAENSLDVPDWINEGSATYYGMYLGYNKNEKEMQKFLKELYAGHGMRNGDKDILYKIFKYQSKKQRIQFLKNLETSGRSSNKDSLAIYAIGALGTELLISDYGQERFTQFYLEFNKSRDWKINFKNAFGISVDSFYVKLSSYVSSNVESLKV